jgi:hypothetical protein
MYGCQTNDDCMGLECVGAVPMMRLGYCKCGEGGTASAACPPDNLFAAADFMYGMMGELSGMPVAVTTPQCISPVNNPLIMGTDMACIMSYGCGPPAMASRFPAACDLEPHPIP